MNEYETDNNLDGFNEHSFDQKNSDVNTITVYTISSKHRALICLF